MWPCRQHRGLLNRVHATRLVLWGGVPTPVLRAVQSPIAYRAEGAVSVYPTVQRRRCGTGSRGRTARLLNGIFGSPLSNAFRVQHGFSGRCRTAALARVAEIGVFDAQPQPPSAANPSRTMRNLQSLRMQGAALAQFVDADLLHWLVGDPGTIL